MALVLAACSSAPEPNRVTDTPIDWWRQLSSGPLASGRPPPPGVGDPYPSLSLVPARPQPTDAQTRRAIAASLAQERDQTLRATANDPLPVAAARPAAPARPATPPAPDPNVSSVVVEAADAPPARPAPRPRAAAPSATPAPSSAQSSGAAPDMPAPIGPAAVAAGELPALPDAPPPRPNVEAAPGAPIPRISPGVPVAFPPGSSDLAQDGVRSLVTLAGQRRSGRVAVIGFGDAAPGSPAGQARTLVLALRRAQVMADALVAAGVPPASIVVDAQAAGRGGTARLID